MKFKRTFVFELVNIGSKLSAIVFKLANRGAMPPKSETTTETITEMYYSIDALRADLANSARRNEWRKLRVSKSMESCIGLFATKSLGLLGLVVRSSSAH